MYAIELLQFEDILLSKRYIVLSKITHFTQTLTRKINKTVVNSQSKY